MEVLLHYLTQYYGMDFISSLFGILSIYSLGNQKKIGFLFGVIAFSTGMVMMVIIESIPFIINNTVLIVLNIHGYLKWMNMEKTKET